MKALILAAGRGKRLEAETESQNKCMLKLRDRHVIEYSLESATSIRADEMVIVVGYKAEDIINTFGISYKGTPMRYVFQHDQRGLVHAIECAKTTLGNDDIALFLGDEILVNPKHKLMLEKFQDEDLFGMCGVLVEKDRKKISGTYTVLQDENDKIYRLIEKPKKPLNDIKGTGSCIFKNRILSYIERTPIHPERGERELPDLIQCAIDEGHLVKSFVICDGYANVNSDDDLREAGALLR